MHCHCVHLRKINALKIAFKLKACKFWRVLQWKILVYFMTIRSILRPQEIYYCHLVYFVVVWYIFPRFGILYEEKSGNPGQVCVLASNLIFYSGSYFCRKSNLVQERVCSIKFKFSPGVVV
jgi:hypothetical protein